MTMRRNTHDLAIGDLPIPTTETIPGSKRERTAEGYLLCRDVPIARVGTMFYAPGELVEV